MRILVLGGAGYIGSHTVLELVKSGHDVIQDIAVQFRKRQRFMRRKLLQTHGTGIRIIPTDMKNRE